MTLLKTLDELDELDGKRNKGRWEFEDADGNQFIVCVVRKGKTRDQDKIRQIAALPGFASREKDFRFIAALANNWPKISKAMRMAVDALNDCTGGDLAYGEGIYKAEVAGDALREINALFEEGK